ncbi:MAG: hypothetical protein ACI81R_000246 [Bradymonadia bacterium]|jgi:hypothetical protein
MLRSRSLIRVCVLVALSTTTLFACTDTRVVAIDGAPSAVEVRTIEQAIRGGDRNIEMTSVVSVLNDGGGACTGSLLAPNLVLTAYHCVAETFGVPSSTCGDRTFGPIVEATRLGVQTTVNSSWDLADHYGGAELYIPPNVDDICEGDLAVIILADNIPASEAVPLVPRIDERVQQEEAYFAVGFGAPRAGTRRLFPDPLEVYCDGLSCGSPEQLGLGDWYGSGAICSGDSGGPALDARGRVIGVASRGDEECTFGIYADVVTYRLWLRELGERAAMLGNYEAPLWVRDGVSTPEGDPDWDGISYDDDNCPDVENLDQLDRDGDGRGDACDDNDTSDRGGDCEICNGCAIDAQCASELCAFEVGETIGYCAELCESDDDCVMNTICREVETDGGAASLCVNDTIDERGWCTGEWFCLERDPIGPDAGEDAGADVGVDAEEDTMAPDTGVDSTEEDVVEADSVAVDVAPDTDEADGTAQDAGVLLPRAASSVGGCVAAPMSVIPWWAFGSFLVFANARRRL